MLKSCSLCKTVGDVSSFPQFKRRGLYHYRALCAVCYGTKKMLSDASYRAARDGLEFSLVFSDITIPALCPMLGCPLSFNVGSSDVSPSLDRIDSDRGYTIDNVQVLSTRANHLKRDATLSELIKLGQWASAYRESL